MGILVISIVVSNSLADSYIPHPNRTKSKCSITFRKSKKFIGKVWSLDKWKRGKPGRAALSAYKHRLICAAGPGHRKAMKALWRREKKSYNEHRKYKLKWGSCTDAGPVGDCIHGAAVTYSADESWMINVSQCESSWDRYAQNPSGSSGLFQFLPSTWETTPYGNKDIWSVKYQSLAAAWMYVVGRSGEWVCSG